MAGLSSFEFFKILIPWTYEEALRLPTKFGEVLGARRDMQLRLAVGLMMPLWDVEVFIDEKHGDMYLCKGLKKFAHAHNLRKGYLLVFRYADVRGDLVVTVFDLATCCKEYLHAACCKEYLHAAGAGGNNANLGTGSLRRLLPIEEPSHFAVTIRQCNLEAKQNQYLNVPVEFQDTHGYMRRRRVELQMGRCSWTVNLKHSKRIRGDRLAFKYRWHQFCIDNRLEVSDVCLFRVIREGSGCADDVDEEWEPEDKDDEHVLKVEVRKNDGTFLS